MIQVAHTVLEPGSGQPNSREKAAQLTTSIHSGVKYSCCFWHFQFSLVLEFEFFIFVSNPSILLAFSRI